MAVNPETAHRTVGTANPPQLRAIRLRRQRIFKAIVLTLTLLFLFIPLASMLLFTVRHPLSGQWSLAPWQAIFTGNGEALGADLTVLWEGLGSSLLLCVGHGWRSCWC